MSTGGAVAATVAVIAAKKREEVLERFRQRGAVSAETALTREELGLGSDLSFRMGALGGALVEVADGRYYLDQPRVERTERFRRVLISGLLAALALTLLILWLAG